MTVRADIPLPLMAVLFFVVITLFFFILGRLTSGSGADLIDWDPAGRADKRRALDHDDMDQMLEMANRRRRAQGLPELTEDEVLRGLER